MIWIVNAAHFDGYAKTSFAEGGACPYTGKTAEQFAAEGYDVLNDEQLNVLPPIGWNGSGFWMSEYTYGDVTAYYQRFGGRYYTSLQRINTSRGEILYSLVRHLESAAQFEHASPEGGR